LRQRWPRGLLRAPISAWPFIKKTGLSRIESASLFETVLKEITDCLERGETVKLSSFGTFVVRKKGQRIGRNPKTGTEVPISPRRVMVFKPSAILKQHIKTGPAGINADVHYAELPQKAPPPT
jgi:integration host factor subunit alpha